MSKNVVTLNAERFKNTAFFSITIRRWGNTAKVKDAAKLSAYLALLAKCDGNAAPPMIEGSTNTKRVTASKKLVTSEALDATNTFLNETKKQCLSLCMPSCVREGMFVASLIEHPGKPSPVAQINANMAAAVQRLHTEFLPELGIELPNVVANAERSPIRLKADNSGEWELDPLGGLGPLYDASDYPRNGDGTLNVSKILSAFGLEWNWLALTVPEGLPPELRAEESAKLQKQFSDAADEVRGTLRVMFSKLVAHAADTLKTGPDEKKKVFRDTLVGNLREFFATFEARDIMGDGDLAALVTRCREVMGDVEADTLRTDDGLRAGIAAKLEEIKTGLAPLVAEVSERQFRFTED